MCLPKFQMAGGGKRSEFIPVLGMPTHVIKYGDINNRVSDKKLVVIIPGELTTEQILLCRV